MKIGVIGDIHGNCQGLEKAIYFLETNKCRIVCLGDLVSDDSDENDDCIQLLHSENILVKLPLLPPILELIPLTY